MDKTAGNRLDLDKAQRDYDELLPKYEQLRNELRYIVEGELNGRQIPFHNLEDRIKTLDSLLAKAKNNQLRKPFEEIDDICGLRIICLFLSDVEKIGKLIEDTFQVESKDDRLITTPQEQFGYFSVHYVGRLPAAYSGPRYDEIKPLRFEIQVRTIAMHAWATITHYLDYKSHHAIPSSLRRDFYAISGMFYMADSHFELFFRSSEEAQLAAEQSALDEKAILSEEINLNTLAAYLKKQYPDRNEGDTGDFSELVEELVGADYKTIAFVDSDRKRSEKAFEKYEKEKFKGSYYNDVGAVRVSLSIANKKFVESRRRRDPTAVQSDAEFKLYRKYLKKLGEV